jgi:heterodisulfide reductase subunit B2
MKSFAFFLGCIMPLRYPGIEAATKLVMKELNVELLEMNGATCCPAPGVIGSFDLENWLVIAARNLSIAEQMGLDITTSCNGCYASLQEASQILGDKEKRERVNSILGKVKRVYDGGTRVRHIVEVVAEDVGFESLRKRVTKPLTGLKVAVHYGCHYLKPSKIRGHGSSERPTFLEDFVKLLGAENIPYKDKTMCCGAGGGVRAGEPSVASDFTLEKVQNIINAGAECILTPCVFCHLQFDIGQNELKNKGLLEDRVPVVYLTQLLGLAMNLSPEKLGLYDNSIPPTYLKKLGLDGGISTS